MVNKMSAGFSTRAIHAGQETEPSTGAVAFPIYLTSTFALDELGKSHAGYEYSRVSNPTRDALEKSLAALEGGCAARVFACGMAAIQAIVMPLSAGDHVVCGDSLYGGTTRLFDEVMAKFGIEFTYVDPTDPENVARAIRKSTKYVYLETPANPLMVLTDIAAVAEVAHAKGVEVVVDNTFMSPYFQRPIELGADLVVHSTTKFLNGHSDGLGGVIVCSTEEQAERFAFVQRSSGSILSPFESWLVLRGIKTLPVRMRQHDENGRIVASFLDRHAKVRKVFYPGLASHPQHELAKRQMKGFGSMMAFETGSLDNAKTLLKNVKLCALGSSLGGVETLIAHPASMSHAALGAEGRAHIGITDGLVRISVGIEDVEDIIADLEQALSY